MQRLHYDIKGMSCAACVSHVERAIRSVLGEHDSFTVSLLTNSVSILMENDFSDTEKGMLEQRLSSAVRAAGYTLLLAPQSKEKTDAEYKKNRTRLLLSAFFTLILMYVAMGGMMGLPIPGFLVGAENLLKMARGKMSITLSYLLKFSVIK